MLARSLRSLTARGAWLRSVVALGIAPSIRPTVSLVIRRAHRRGTRSELTERHFLVDTEQAHLAFRHQLAVGVANPRFPELARAPARDRARRRCQLAAAHRANERRRILQPHDALPARMGDDGGADRRQRLDDAGVHAAVDDAVTLVVLVADVDLAGHLVGAGGEDADAGLFDPAAGEVVDEADEVHWREDKLSW